MTPELANKRRRQFERRRKAAAEGRHLPSLRELLQGCPLMSNSTAVDAQVFAERLLHRIPGINGPWADLRAALGAVTVNPGAAQYRAAHAAFMMIHHEYKPVEQDLLDDDQELLVIGRRAERAAAPKTLAATIRPAESAMRFAFYAAATGCRDSAAIVAMRAVAEARLSANSPVEFRDFLTVSVGWLQYAAFMLPQGQRPALPHYLRSETITTSVLKLGNNIVETFIDQLDAQDALREQQQTAAVPPSPSPPAQVDDGVVVLRAIGSPDTTGGKTVVQQFGKFTNLPMRLVPVPELEPVYRAMCHRYPHARALTWQLLCELGTKKHVGLKPIVLLGEPGSGKTSFCRDLLELLGVPHRTYPCAGVADGSFGGCPRHWNSTEPSHPLALITAEKVANPAFILDEIEKVAKSRNNGNLLDVLLPMLEQHTAASWFDPHVQAPIDLSHMVWLATANSADLPAQLRDRLRIVRFPEPGPQHLEHLAREIVRNVATAQGLDPRWAQPLDEEELDALRGAWSGGSLRKLNRLVEAVLKARGEGALQ